MDILGKISKWYFSKNALPYWGILLIDSIILLASEFLMFFIGNGVVATLQSFWHVAFTACIYWICYIIGFRIFHTYSGIIRYSSFVDLYRVALGVSIGFVCATVFNIFAPELPLIVHIDILYILAWTLLTLMLMWLVRVMVKALYDTTYKSANATKVFIYGIRQGGVSIAKAIRNRDPAEFTLDGFIADNMTVHDMMLMGVKVYNKDEVTIDLMKRRGVKAILVSPMLVDALRDSVEFFNRLIDEEIKIFIVSTMEWDGKRDFATSQLREIEIDDLLPRDKIEIDMLSINNTLSGHRIMITGAAGSIGSEIVNQVAQFKPAELILIDQAETPLHDIRLMMAAKHPDIKAFTIVADISNPHRMRKIFATHRPEYVFHAAAYKHVPMMENNPGESIQNNVEGTRIIADLAVEFGATKFVMISTDKAVNPTNVMGCSKRICEIYVQSLDKAIKDGKIKGVTQFVTTRFGNVLGSNGSVIPLFKQQIKAGGPITVTHPDIIRYFMLIPEACKLVLEAGSLGNGGEIFIFDMGEPVKIVDLARRMIKLSGADIDIVFTGLRHGEKLYEEVLNDKEITLPTFHPKIKIAKVREYDYDIVSKEISQLVDSCTTHDDMTIVALMKKLVPEFKSKNSIYEKLDSDDQN